MRAIQVHDLGQHMRIPGIRLRTGGGVPLPVTSGGSRRTELLLLSAHLAAYVAGVLLVMSPVKALLFAVIHEGVFGLYMGCAFAPNHKVFSNWERSPALRARFSACLPSGS
jgi:hypothetical protein